MNRRVEADWEGEAMFDCNEGRCITSSEDLFETDGSVTETEDWPYNSIAFGPVEIWRDVNDGEIGDPDYQFADSPSVRHAIRLSSGYKPGREEDHPVTLTREDALTFAGDLIEAIEDTFHYTRRGRLTGAQAKHLLDIANKVQMTWTS